MKFSDQLLTIWSRILNTSNKFELILSNRNFNNKNHLNYWLKIFEKYNLPVNRLNILQSKNNNQNRHNCIFQKSISLSYQVMI